MFALSPLESYLETDLSQNISNTHQLLVFQNEIIQNIQKAGKAEDLIVNSKGS